ncbi:ABC transporter permease subunit [Streptomyces sp. NPDC006743]|uniref:ABC transporter permease subunit n=1 Tax=Streptomyces sp. NPDC006743 TaxID=3154480 RepID=UPI00345715E5
MTTTRNSAAGTAGTTGSGRLRTTGNSTGGNGPAGHGVAGNTADDKGADGIGADRTGRGGDGRPGRLRGVLGAVVWRAGIAAALLGGIGLLPWLTRTDPALTVLKARSADRDPTPEVLADIRDRLGLDDGPLRLLAHWLGGLVRADAGRSWLSGEAVTPAVLRALSASLLLMAVALAVAVATAALVCAPTLRRGARGRAPRGPGGGSASAMLAALPEFLTASVLATVVGVQLGWLPALGWYGARWTVLPALALGLPAGAVLGRLLDDLLPGAFAEPWAKAAAARGLPGRRVARHALHRCLPGLLPNLGLFAVGLTGGAVAVEQVFDIPGLGRTTLQAALAQDLPVLQAGALVLVLLAAAASPAARLAARLLTGPAVRDGALPTLHPPRPRARRALPLLHGGLLLAVVLPGLPRDPLALNTTERLRAPSLRHPFGTDALGRDLLARVGHGALDTVLLALAISAACLLAGVLLGLLPRLSGPLVDTANAVPPVLAALLTTAVWGSGPATPALAVAAVAWAPLAAHTSALLRQERAALHLAATRALGAGRLHLLHRHLLPAVLPAVTRHALLRLPGVALALASLGFLGLGAQPPSAEWGLLLAENQPYAERAPWAVLAPAAVLALLGALAVTAAGGLRGTPRPRPRRSAAPPPSAAVESDAARGRAGAR